MKHRLQRIYSRKPLLLLGVTVILIAVLASCTGAPALRGWAGVTPAGNNMLYTASMDGRILAISATARAQNLPFPAQGEWVYPAYDRPALRAPVRSAGLGCAPQATGVGVYGNPAVSKPGDETLVYVTSDAGKVYAVNAANGQYRWEYPHEQAEAVGTIIGTPVVSGNNLYLTSSDGNLYALDPKTGDRRWSFATGARIWGTPAVTTNTIYVGNFGGSGYAVSASDGRQIWKVDLGSAVASVATSGNIVTFGTFDNQLHAYNTGGSPQWKFLGGNWFWAPPLFSGDTVYASSLDHNVYSLNLKTGNQNWKYDAAGPVNATPILRGDNLTVVTQLGIIHMINVKDGSQTKTISIGSEVLAPPSTADGTVYLNARDQRVYAVNLDTGTVAWRQSLAPTA